MKVLFETVGGVNQEPISSLELTRQREFVCDSQQCVCVCVTCVRLLYLLCGMGVLYVLACALYVRVCFVCVCALCARVCACVRASCVLCVHVRLQCACVYCVHVRLLCACVYCVCISVCSVRPSSFPPTSIDPSDIATKFLRNNF